MRLSIAKRAAVLVAVLVTATAAADVATTRQRPLPAPVLVLIGHEFFESGGKQWTRYKYTVANMSVYPDELFAAAPELPPCAGNAKAARTWVDLYEQSGKRLYGFCALAGNRDLGKIWFALERDKLPPSWIYLEMTDRKTNTRYKSNLAETVL